MVVPQPHREHDSEESEYMDMPTAGEPNQITIMHEHESEESEVKAKSIDGKSNQITIMHEHESEV